MKPKASIIICSRNRGAQLGRCLDSIHEEEMLAAAAELVLTDNGSTDDTHQIMERHADRARYPVVVRQVPDVGLSRARNAGIDAATGDLLLFTDDDCYMDPGYIPLAVEIFESEEFDFGGGQAVLYEERDAFVGYNLFEQRKRLEPGRFVPAGTIQGSSMIFRRRVVEEIGYFDCMLGAGTPFPCEDIDYVARASFAGFTGGKFPELVVRHDHGRRTNSEYRDTLRSYDYGRGAYYAKYILEGRLSFLFHWPQHSFEPERSVFNELASACRYVMTRVRAYSP
jgi:glycosyltransferase involved in cell wall biosynthesis